jgi:large subunit ribosomal protein L4
MDKKDSLKNIDIVNTGGKVVGSFALDTVVFDGKVNHQLLHQAVTAYLSNKRLGLASTLTRGEVSGGGKKPWRQKGTGRARVGSIRSPLWRKGGTLFGPKPHSFYKDLPKKMRISSLKNALNSKANDNEMLVLDTLDITSGKTKDFFKVLRNLNLDGQRLCFVVETISAGLKRAYRNIAGIGLNNAADLNAYDALNCKKLIITKEALEKLQERIKKCLA